MGAARAPPQIQAGALCFELAEGGSSFFQTASQKAHAGGICSRAGGVFPVHTPALPHSGPSLQLSPVGSSRRRSAASTTAGNSSSPAQQLQAHLGRGLAAPAELRDAVLQPARVLERPSLAVRIGSMLQPQGETQCDRTWAERALNIATSLPFSLVGLYMLRQRQTPEGRRHAVTMMGVGAAAALYHASTGSFRPAARKIDYWTIAYSASEMTRALYPASALARRLSTASLLAVPFRPFLVSATHAAVMEVEFIRQARAHRGLRRALALHATTAAAGTAAFFLEDAVKEVGFEHMHGIWHCLACLGCASMNGLLAHKERRHLAGEGRRAGGRLQLQTHCSASSLLDLQQHSSGKKA